jgi:hypothetical protein
VLQTPNASLTPLSAESATPLNFGSSTRGRPMNHPAGRLVVYETLYALNRDFEQVVAHLERLQELGMFERYLGNVFPIIVQETRAWANFEVFETLQPREQEDLTHFGRLHIDVLKDAGVLLDQGRKKRQKAAGKKGQRKLPGAGSWRISGLAPVRDPRAARRPPSRIKGSSTGSACPLLSRQCRRSKPRTNSKGTGGDCFACLLLAGVSDQPFAQEMDIILGSFPGPCEFGEVTEVICVVCAMPCSRMSSINRCLRGVISRLLQIGMWLVE